MDYLKYGNKLLLVLDESTLPKDRKTKWASITFLARYMHYLDYSILFIMLGIFGIMYVIKNHIYELYDFIFMIAVLFIGMYVFIFIRDGVMNINGYLRQFNINWDFFAEQIIQMLTDNQITMSINEVKRNYGVIGKLIVIHPDTNKNIFILCFKENNECLIHIGRRTLRNREYINKIMYQIDELYSYNIQRHK